MSWRPDAAALLTGVAELLDKELRGAVSADPALQFRVVIAANLARIVAGEWETGEAVDLGEIEALRGLLGEGPDAAGAGGPAGGRAEREALLRELRRRVAERIRGDSPGEGWLREAAAALRQPLATRVLSQNPRFDLRDEIE